MLSGLFISPAEAEGKAEDPLINGKAITFLSDKTKGKRVFLKFDNMKYDAENKVNKFNLVTNLQKDEVALKDMPK